MDKDTIKSHLKTIKELILDEQKLITYVSLSKELCIHINDAKSLLDRLVKDIRNTKPKIEINVCYLISGLTNNNSACTTVCSETDIGALRETLNIVFYEHVYCVSRGFQGVDNVALAAVNKFEDLSLCTGLIKATSCLKRSDDEVERLKSSSNHGITIESNPNNPISNTKKEVVKHNHENVKKVTEVKSEPVVKSKTPSPKKDVSTNSKTSIVKNGTKPVAKGIAGFFNKFSGDSNKQKNTKVKEEKRDVIEKDVKVKVEPPTTEEIIPIKKEKDEPKTSKQNNKSKTENKSINSVKEDKSTNNSLKQIKKNAKVDKKRKRVLHVSDSESETETNDDPFADDDNKMTVDHESDDEIPPTPTVNTVKITSGMVNPKKKRKIVDKTYTDEDGYILTKKEEVYESCSDNEVEVNGSVKQEKENIKQEIHIKTEISPKENVKTKKKKVSPPQKGKQQTLTNFFKKM